MTGKERLRVLAEHLATVPAERFRMDVWLDKAACGTVGCAVGHGMDNPVLKAEGLLPSPAGYPTLIRKRQDGTRILLEGFCAVEDFFELNAREAGWLFMETAYDLEAPIQPQDVIVRINKYLSDNP